ncbi:SMI1/KNR4 family protein [Bacillus sp. D386]|uniref:SMI1/KNR4 family protein n=3 Tax=Bacillales TaxID=1385 RepID=UPI00111FFBB0|nr:SMI1/KNR4 family protein [Bacillus sp. D386]
MKKVINKINPKIEVAGVSLIELKKTERTLGATFPEEYKELFLETNGATFGEWTLYSIQANEQLAFTMDIVRQNQENRPKNMPDEFICIGDHINGNNLCYRIRKRFMQELIFLWDDKKGKCECKASTLSEFIDWYVPKKTNKPKILGTFTIESGKLIVTDPCYDKDEEDLQVLLLNVKNGKWTAYVTHTDEEAVQNLFVYYGEKKPSGRWHDCAQAIAVDSAQAGIFDFDVFQKDETIPYELINTHDIEIDEASSKYYVVCCDMTDTDEQAGVVPGGAVSMSGYGDGMYEVKVKYNIFKQVVGVMITFEDEE